ncbi:MAG: hypothetical protein ACOYI9_06125 [Candidatus Hydrogenedentales bacterium]|jgi:hypothetical protein
MFLRKRDLRVVAVSRRMFLSLSVLLLVPLRKKKMHALSQPLHGAETGYPYPGPIKRIDEQEMKRPSTWAG